MLCDVCFALSCGLAGPVYQALPVLFYRAAQLVEACIQGLLHSAVGHGLC